jgi:hypothetical protein
VNKPKTAQDLRDRLASVRSFTVLVDGEKIEEVVIDIANSLVHILTEEGRVPEVEEEKEKRKEEKKIDGASLLLGKGGKRE